MKKLILTIAIACLGSFAFAGDEVWSTDLNDAMKTASQGNKHILVNFSGSDWCGWCKRLDREVLRKDTFLKYAEESLVLVNLDFPQYKQLPKDLRIANENARRKYGVQGFPTVLLLDAKGSVILRTGYIGGSPSDYVQHLQAAIRQSDGP